MSAANLHRGQPVSRPGATTDFYPVDGCDRVHYGDTFADIRAKSILAEAALAEATDPTDPDEVAGIITRMQR